MRLLILGAGGEHRTEASLARAAATLGHTAAVLDVPAHRRFGEAGLTAAAWRAERFGPEFVLCTRHAIGLGEARLAHLFRRRPSAFWYFDPPAPLPEPVVHLARLAARTFATYGYQVEAFRAAGAAEAQFLPQGMDPELDHPAGSIPPDWRCDASFVGSGHYPRRYAVLRAVAGACRLQIRGPRWEDAPRDLPVAGGSVRGRRFAQAVGGAAVSLGIDALEAQRGERQGGTSNRLWRVLGAGGCYLGEQVPGSEAMVTTGEHALWYRTADEAVDLLRQLLADPARQRRLREAGRAHALARHTYAHRLALLLAGQGYTST